MSGYHRDTWTVYDCLPGGVGERDEVSVHYSLAAALESARKNFARAGRPQNIDWDSADRYESAADIAGYGPGGEWVTAYHNDPTFID